MAPGKPIATLAGISITPKLLGIVGIVVVVVLVVAAVFAYLNLGSKPGSIMFSPSTISCSSSTSVTETVRLPSSLHYADQISLKLDGVDKGSGTVGHQFAQELDGTWTATSQLSASEACGLVSMGKHTLQILDANGNVLAEGTYTLTP